MPTQKREIEQSNIYMVRSTPIGRDKRTWKINRRIHGFDLRNYSGWIDTTESPVERINVRGLLSFPILAYFFTPSRIRVQTVLQQHTQEICQNSRSFPRHVFLLSEVSLSPSLLTRPRRWRTPIHPFRFHGSPLHQPHPNPQDFPNLEEVSALHNSLPFVTRPFPRTSHSRTKRCNAHTINPQHVFQRPWSVR